MKHTLLSPFSGYREQAAAVIYRFSGDNIEVLLAGRGPEHGWPAEWWDFPGGGVNEQVDGGRSLEQRLRNCVAREVGQELALGAFSIGYPEWTGITRTAPFRSESAVQLHAEYSGKRLWYFTILFLGSEGAIRLADRLTRYNWVDLPNLVEAVRPESKETAKSILRLKVEDFFPPKSMPYGAFLGQGFLNVGRPYNLGSIDEINDIVKKASE